MTAILGISAFYHDSAAALVVDGEVVAAAQEERFSRIKHDDALPVKAIESCLSQAGIRPEDLDYVTFYEKPLLKFDRLLQTYVSYAPAGFRSFGRAMPIWLRQKLHITRELHKGLDGRYSRRFVFCEHHESHAASAFFPSPFDDAAILTLDGVGEWTTGAVGLGTGNRIRLLSEMKFPHSLGLLYSAFTSYCGFRVNSGEYKLMGLAPYGDPIFAGTILEHLLDLKEDGSLRLDMSYFKFARGLTMTTEKFHRLFGGPPRDPESDLTQREMDLAASIQEVTDEAVLRAGRFAHRATGARRLCMAGGVALNCVSNRHLLENGPFDDIWVQPAAGDAGGALGAALLVWHQLLDRPRFPATADRMSGSFLGPRFEQSEVERRLCALDAPFEVLPESEVTRKTAGLLAAGMVVGWFQDRMEFGPRALGSRSILGDPRDPAMQSKMNLKIKFRESFRPFAPAVLAEHANQWFDMGKARESPYMLLVVPVARDHRVDGADFGAAGLERLKLSRSDIPAVTHVDFSARVQTVDRSRNGRFYDLLAEFENQTGCPVLINTSFNVRGEPIVCTPEDAYRCFMATGMDALVAGNCLLLKSDQPETAAEVAADHLRQFALD